MSEKDSFLTMAQAIQLFYEIADCEALQHHNANTCLVRCLETAEMIERYTGVDVQKICAFSHFDDKLTVKGMKEVERMGGWVFHTAPAVPVMWENGDIRIMIFDPTLFDAPVDINQWRKHINARHGGFLVGDLDATLTAPEENYYKLMVKPLSAQQRHSLKYQYFQAADGKKRPVAKSKAADVFFQTARDLKRRKSGQSWAVKSPQR